MNNKGWEINLNTNKLIQKGKFWMDLNFTFANNKNEITRMDPRVLETLNSDWVAENRKLLQRVQVDNPFGAIYGYRYKGVYIMILICRKNAWLPTEMRMLRLSSPISITMAVGRLLWYTMRTEKSYAT